MKPILSLLFLTALFSFDLLAQTPADTLQVAKKHKHPKNEIGIAISPAYFVKENVFSLSAHLHYTRTIADSKFALGLSFERIFLAPEHTTMGFVMMYRPIENLNLALSPGVTFEDGDPTAFFNLHVEIAYTFEIGRFHIGPAVEFSYDPNDYHLGLGAHIGYGF